MLMCCAMVDVHQFLAEWDMRRAFLFWLPVTSGPCVCPPLQWPPRLLHDLTGKLVQLALMLRRVDAKQLDVEQA